MQVFDPNTPEGQEQIRQRQKRHYRNSQIWLYIWLVLGIVLIVGGDMLANQWWYGDWKCAYRKCVRTTEIKQP